MSLSSRKSPFRQWRSWSWGCAVLLVVGLMLLRTRHITIPNPNLLFALLVVWSAFEGGLLPGLGSALIALLFSLWDWSVPGHPFTYTPQDRHRLVLAILAMPLMAILVGRLKARLLAQQLTLERYLAVEKEKNLALKEAMENPHGVVSACAWCRRVRDRDGTWVSLEAFLAGECHYELTHGICPDCAPGLLKQEET
nr:DUF4118 domain-containing protein [uncultured Holophaga sp.]